MSGLLSYRAMWKSTSLVAFAPATRVPSRVRTESVSGSSLPMQEPVGVARILPSGKSTLMLPADPVAYPLSYSVLPTSTNSTISLSYFIVCLVRAPAGTRTTSV